MQNYLRSATATAVLGLLAACGGGTGADGIGSGVVSISIDAPTGVMEGGQLIRVTGTARSESNPLASMGWVVSTTGPAGSDPTVSNADCAQVSKTDSSFGSGSSLWRCSVSMLVPAKLSGNATYNVSLSGATKNGFSKSGSIDVSVKPAPVSLNPVQVNFAAVPVGLEAGQVLSINGTISSSASKLASANWTFADASNTFSSIRPVLENADCSSASKNENPTGQASSVWGCTVRMVVPPTLSKAATYKLSLTGTNADGFAAANTVNVDVAPASTQSNTISVAFGALPAASKAGQLITLNGTVTSTASLLSSMSWTVAGASNVAANVVPTLTNADCAQAAKSDNQSGQQSSVWNCAVQMLVPTTLRSDAVYTLALTGKNANNYTNFGTLAVPVAAASTVNPLQIAFSALPTNLKAGQVINVQGTITSPDDLLSTARWNIVNSAGTTPNIVATLGNADCSQISKQDNPLGSGSSVWTCATQLTVPAGLPTNTTYSLALTGTTVGKMTFSNTIDVPVATADKTNTIAVAFDALPTNLVAGQVMSLTGTVTSTDALLTGLNWNLVGATNNASVIPTLSNADCAVVSKTDQPAGAGSSTWKCSVQMNVSPTLAANSTYSVALTGKNANNLTNSAILNVPVTPISSTNVVSVVFDALPTNLTAGQAISLKGTVTSSTSLLSTLNWSIVKSSGSAADVVPTFTNGDCAQVSKTDNPNGAGTSTWACAANLIVPQTLASNVTYTVALTGKNANGLSNFATEDVAVVPAVNALKLAVTAYKVSPVTVNSGATVTMACQAQGGRPTIELGDAAATPPTIDRTVYAYQWLVTNASGLYIPMSAMGGTGGDHKPTFVAPAVVAPTTVTFVCASTDANTGGKPSPDAFQTVNLGTMAANNLQGSSVALSDGIHSIAISPAMTVTINP